MPRPSRQVAAYLLFATAGACAGLPKEPPSPVPLSTATSDAPSWTVPEFPANIYDQIDDEKDREDVVKLVVVATGLVTGTEFRAALASLPDLDTGRPGGEDVPTVPTIGRTAARVFLGLEAEDGSVRLPAEYSVACNPWFTNETAVTGLENGRAKIRLREVVLSRFRSGTPEAVSCAINTLVHEWTHAIALGSGSNVSLYQDRTHNKGGQPLVSYTFGAVAQCVYLRSHYEPAIPLAVCIAAAGTRGFEKRSCEAGWAKWLIRPAPASASSSSTEPSSL